MKRLMVRNAYVDGEHRDLTVAEAVAHALDGDDGDAGRLEVMNQTLEKIRERFGELIEALLIAKALPHSFMENVEEVDYTELIKKEGYTIRLTDLHDQYPDITSIWLIKPDGEAVDWIEAGQSEPETNDHRKVYFNNDIEAYACLRKMLNHE